MKSRIRVSFLSIFACLFIIGSLFLVSDHPSKVSLAASIPAGLVQSEPDWIAWMSEEVQLVDEHLPYLPVSALAPDQAWQSNDSWVTLMSEGFEGEFPSPGWHIGREGADYLWAKTSCQAHTGTYTIGSHFGGTLGSALTCTDEYPLSYVTTLSYGPFDLTGCTDVRVNFAHLTKLALIDDFLSFGYSIDGGVSWYLINWQGDFTEYCDGWCEWSIYAAQFPSITLCGQTRVYLLFRFQSDWYEQGFGSFIDDVALQALYGSPLPTWDFFLPLVMR